ncbi:MAG: hypothetical protein ACOC7T_04520 [Planctomycetota bacterium]
MVAKLNRVLPLLAVALCLLAGAARADTIWTEGEDHGIAMVRSDPAYAEAELSKLSGAELVSHSADRPGVVQYRFGAPEAGEYAFWIRCSTGSAGLSYRLNGGPWTAVDLDRATDPVSVGGEGESARSVAWVPAGEVGLKASNALLFRFEGDGASRGAIDCFMLTDGELTPSGTEKPDDVVSAQPSRPRAGGGRSPGGGSRAGRRGGQLGTWAFTPGRDTFSDRALLDLRDLNEEVAGQHGFVRTTGDGGFVRGDGEPIRFWAANTSVWQVEDANLMYDHARFLAKRGVNTVRWHGSIEAKKEGSKLGDIDPQARDNLWRGVAAAKKAGVYTTLSPYYPHRTKVRKSWNIDSPQGNMTCLVFFDPRVQDAYKSWLRAIFEPENPHTGVPLKDEPAVAIIQVQNEDSMLFWTVDQVKGGERRLLERKFGDWVAEKYGSLRQARQAWQGTELDGDAPSAGRMAIYDLWNLTGGPVDQFGPPGPGEAARKADQTQFYVHLMRSWFEEVERFLREEIGAQQVINAGNWKTADTLRLGDLERYAYTANQVVGVNRYYGGGAHIGKNSGWAIVNGDKFANNSVLFDPVKLPVALKQPAGHPIIIPESNWVPPLAYQSEGPFLTAVFQSLNGVDALYWFSFAGMNAKRPQWPQGPNVQWRQPASANGYLSSIGKWTADTPEVLGNFPAAALLWRRGYVQRGEAAVHERRNLADLWHRRVPIIAEAGTFDPNRDRGQFAPESNIKQDVDRLAYGVGPVEVTFGADPSESKVGQLGEYIDRDAGVVGSNTGQVEWDYGRGICTLNAPKARGVTGFLNRAGRFELGDLTVESGNDYATVFVVSMDDKELAASGRILVQCGTVARPTGWRQRPTTWQDDQGNRHEGFEVVNFGQAPWRIVENDVTVTLRNEGLSEATALDPNGMPRGQAALERDGETVTLTMPRDAKYVVLQ